jgi:hypothetical protein
MFSDCADQEQIMDVPEKSSNLNILFRLLHEPPQLFAPIKPTPAKAFGVNPPVYVPDMSTVVPLPLIPLALTLADKYILHSSVLKALHSHIGAHVTTQPLEVYGLATSLGLDELASDASEYLLHPPLASYSLSEIKVVPTVQALHQLVRLQALREAKLKDMLQGEMVFPHDYGLCSSHGTATKALWEERKRVLSPWIRAGWWSLWLHLSAIINLVAGTDVAAEMGNVMEDVGSCKVCKKACDAAVDMLAVSIALEARRVPADLFHSTNARRSYGRYISCQQNE